jgi:heparosan-N-sulfate-glucuronate 5-epimerase
VTRPEALSMPPLNCSLDQALGDYYQDFSAAIELVETGYHGGQDERGIPLTLRADGQYTHPTLTAQYALANIIVVGRGAEARLELVRSLLDWLVDAQTDDGLWFLQFDNPKYRWLKAPWTSGLAIGNSISALLRGWQMVGDDRYRESAELAYRALHDERNSLVVEQGDELWYEEYPAEPPLHVLNGHVYTLLGVADYARATGDAEAHTRWRRAADSVATHLAEFDLGYWSAYDLRSREPVSLHYQKNIHVPQLRILAALTGETRFGVTADRWAGYLNSRRARLRWQVALRMQRWRR